MSVKVDIISGFLGAGKTTLIKKMIEEGQLSERLAIIENEFGEVGIDRVVLKDTAVEIKEISSGCICCTLAGDFEQAIKELIESYNPRRILIEPSGVGKLSDVIKGCSSPNIGYPLILDRVITVVDVMKYKSYQENFGEFFDNQIIHAKTIVLSRTQDADTQKIEAVVWAIQKMNPKATVISTPWDLITAEQMLTIEKLKHPQSIAKDPFVIFPVAKEDHDKECVCGTLYNANEVFAVWGVETPRIFNKEELKSLVMKLECLEYGTVLRGKGVVQLEDNGWAQFDFVPGEYREEPIGAECIGKLCVIGKDLNEDALNALFRRS